MQNCCAWRFTNGRLVFSAGRLKAAEKCLIDLGYQVSVEDQRAIQSQMSWDYHVVESVDPDTCMTNAMLKCHLGRIEVKYYKRMGEIVDHCVSFFAKAKILLVVAFDSYTTFFRKSLTHNPSHQNRLERKEIEIVSISRLRNRMPRIWDIVLLIDVEELIDKDSFAKISRLTYRRLYSLFCYEPFPDPLAAVMAEFLAGQIIFSDRPDRESSTVQCVSAPAQDSQCNGTRSSLPDNPSTQKKPSLQPNVMVKFHPVASRARNAYARFRDPSIIGEDRHRNCRESNYLTCSASNAIRILRDCGELGGNLVANLLVERAEAVAVWEVDWDVDSVAVRGIVENRLSIQARAYYDRLPFGECCADSALAAYQILVSNSNSSEGHKAPPELARDVADLAVITWCRLLPSLERAAALDHDEPFPIGPNELATILDYEFAAKPAVVAEAILALHANAHDAQEWLLDTLETFPKLELLAKQVGKHLASRDDLPLSLRKRVSKLVSADLHGGSSD